MLNYFCVKDDIELDTRSQKLIRKAMAIINVEAAFCRVMLSDFNIARGCVDTDDRCAPFSQRFA